MKGTDTLIAQLYNRPVLVDQNFNAAEYMGDISPDFLSLACLSAAAMFGGDFASGGGKQFPFQNGVAVIPVTGMLLNRFPYAFSFATGYNAIRSMMTAAVADPDVKGIAFDVNSPGGMVQGCFELCDDIFAARGEKPMKAVVDGNATSAAYAIASAVGNISAPKSARIGSIGVVMMHVDVSEALDKDGVKVTQIYAGKHKVDGTPYKPLSKDMKADMQATVDGNYEDFVNLVARNRGIDAQVARDTEAKIYGAQDAKTLGLIDSVAAPSDAYADFASGLSGLNNLGVSAMSDEKKPGAADAATPDVKAIEANASAAGKTAERTRIQSIIGLAEAKDRTALANHLALSTDLSVETAKGILAASPVVVAAAAEGAKDNGFKAVMAATENPNLQAGGAEVVDDKSPAAIIARMQGNYALATGNKIKKS